MYIVTATKETPVREKQIDAPIQKLWIKATLTTDFFKNSNHPLMSTMLFLNDIKISIEKQTPNGNDPMLLPIGLGTIGEICSNNEGHFNVKATETSATVEMSIDLASGNAVHSADGKFLLLTVDTSTSTIPVTLEIYGVEFPVISSNYTEYKQLKVSANTQKSISLIGKDILSIPRDNFISMDIVFPDRTVTYKDDIKAITQAIENLCGNYVYLDTTPEAGDINARMFAQSCFDGITRHTIGILGAIEAKLLYSADCTIVLTEQK
jgi:hypothetical protein